MKEVVVATPDELAAAWQQEVLQHAVPEIVNVVRAVGRLSEIDLWRLMPYTFQVSKLALARAVDRGLLAVERPPTGAVYTAVRPVCCGHWVQEHTPRGCGLCDCIMRDIELTGAA